MILKTSWEIIFCLFSKDCCSCMVSYAAWESEVRGEKMGDAARCKDLALGGLGGFNF